MTAKNVNRREVLIGAVGAVTAAALPALSLPEPELGALDWLEQAELDAIRSTWSRPPAGHFVVRDMLTPDEIADLRRKAKEASAYARKAYPHLRMAEKA
jgi:hypothetical protein